MIVVDGSAAVTALLNAGPARQALAEERVQVPHLIDSEVANVLRRGVAASRIEPGDARTPLDRWRRLGVSRYAGFHLLARVWELRENLSAPMTLRTLRWPNRSTAHCLPPTSGSVELQEYAVL